ncbi:hypothetical protein JOC47_003026 [Halanaerobacter jeridensis]|uniref:Uncharacterized protein n=1 Tax=Halanaerobacter jeridensis TaxID=706427 RepID=A0A939BTD8_9FIRM|nr:hypothetical protein [Halanaerobacter jeridensis]
MRRRESQGRYMTSGYVKKLLKRGGGLCQKIF